MKLKASLEYSDKISCFELKLFQNEPKKLSLGDATVKQKIGHCICVRRVSSSNGLKFGHELTSVQLEMYVTAPVLRPTGGRPQAICQKRYMLTVHTSECIPSLQLRLLGVSVTDVVA